MMKWGFLGIGRVTPRMVEAVRHSGNHQLVAVAGRDALKLAQWAAGYSVPNTFTDFRSLVESDRVDGIYIALPPSLHHEWSVQALRAGKHVLCEKPMAMDHRESLAMQSEALSENRRLIHATALPHHPRSQSMRDVVRSGVLGEIVRVTMACTFSHVLRRGPDYRTQSSLGGGCLLDLGWYCAWTTLWMTGLKPVSIQSIGRRLDPACDTSPWKSVQAIVELEGGAVAIWDCGFDAAGRKWMEIAGSEASLICDDFLRPWDQDKPRYWIHQHDGKAQCVIVAPSWFQEAAMLDAMQADEYPWREELALAVETQRILETWESTIISVRSKV